MPESGQSSPSILDRVADVMNAVEAPQRHVLAGDEDGLHAFGTDSRVSASGIQGPTVGASYAGAVDAFCSTGAVQVPGVQTDAQGTTIDMQAIRDMVGGMVPSFRGGPNCGLRANIDRDSNHDQSVAIRARPGLAAGVSDDDGDGVMGLGLTVGNFQIQTEDPVRTLMMGLPGGPGISGVMAHDLATPDANMTETELRRLGLDGAANSWMGGD